MKARFFAIAALVLGLASCQKDFAPEANLGGEVDYRLEVSAPALGTTRAGDTTEQNAKDSAFGAIDYFQGADWSQVDLRYTLEIYDADDNGDLKGGVATIVKDRQAIVVDEYKAVTFETRLAPKRNYRFVVFADFVENGAATAWTEAQKLTADGLNHSFAQSLTNITLINEEINDEASDAYFAFKHVVPSNNTHNTDAITLTRPYGKVRVVATDLAELNLNVKPGSVKVIYDAFNANAFNAVEGTISGEYETKEFDYNYADGIVYTEGYDALKNEKDRNTHMTLFTDYILATDAQSTIHFDMLVNDTEGVEIKYTSFNTEIPVQRNHLTTIIGNVLTTATEVEVTINDNFYAELTKELKIAYNAKTLQQYIDEANPGDTIYVGEDCICEGVFYVGKSINIEAWGANSTITGKIGVAYGDGTTTFKGIKFVANDQTATAIPNNNQFLKKNAIVPVYTASINFVDCVFEGMTEDVYAIRNDNNAAEQRLTFENCKFNGNRAIRTRANVVVDGCTFEGNTKPAVDVLGFGATDAEGYVQFTNNYSTANVAGVMLKVGNFEFRHVVFNVGGNSEAAINSIWRDEAFNHKNLANFTREFTNEVKTINYAETEDYVVASAQELQLLLDNDDLNELQIEVNAPIDYVGKGFEINRDAVIDFQGNALNAGSTATSYWYALQIYGSKVDIYNANFTRAGIFAGEGANVTFYSSKIIHNPGRTGRYIFCAQSGSTITVEGGEFKNNTKSNKFFWADDATIIVKGGKFYGTASNTPVYLSNNGKVIIYGGTFNFDPTAYVAEGYIAKKSGSNWVVKLDAVEDAAQLADALANAAEGDKINLMDGVNYGAITAGELKNVTINGAENSVVNFITDANTVIENVTLNGVDFVYDGSNVNSGVVINGEAQIENLVLDGCSFVGTGEKKGRGIYGTNPNATIVIKNTTFKDLGYPIYTMANNGGYKSLTVEECTFEGIKSWAIMPQYNPYTGDLTVNKCNFVNCVGGFVRAGGFTAGHTFTFTNNTITNSAEHPAKNWFQVTIAEGTAVVENNTKDGAAWTPGSAEGIN